MMEIEPTDLAAGLYIVATPLGHARDITLRALDVLSGVDVILCEDTRISGKLLARYHIKTRKWAYHEHNGAAMQPKIIARLAEGAALALISDAGTPLISDPGMPLVRAVRAAGFPVFAIPGACAPIAALSIAGLPSDRFTFVGFLPPRAPARRRALARLDAQLGAQAGTLIVFESARRLLGLFDDIADTLGARDICVARELTKKFEQVTSGTVDALRAHFAATPPKGEIVVLIGPGDDDARLDMVADAATLDAMLQDAMATMSRRDAVRLVAEMSGCPRKTVYARALALGAADGRAGNNKNDATAEKPQSDG